MSERIALGNATRFRIFERDGFRCVYCGSQPRPDNEVWLQVDHVIPVVKGGTNDDSNLVASCQQCNHGKHARIIHAAPRPDLVPNLYRVWQEIAEAREFNRAVAERANERAETMGLLEEEWAYIASVDSFPFRGHVESALNKYPPDVILSALKITATKCLDDHFTLSRGNITRYFWGVCHKIGDNGQEAK